MAAMMTAVADAGDQAETYHSGRPMTEPGVVRTDTVGQVEPPKYDYPRQPFGGFRMVTARFVHALMPNVVPTPSKFIAPHRAGYDFPAGARGPAPQNRAAVAYVPVAGVERPAWYETDNSDHLNLI